MLRSKKIAVFISAKTQFENLGDAIINRVLFEMSRKYGDVFVNINGVPDSFVRLLNLREEETKNWGGVAFIFSMLKKLVLGYDVFLFLKPGHIYHRDSLSLVLSHFFKSIVILVLALCGVKIHRVGASMGPFGRIGELLEIIQSRMVRGTYVREDNSLLYCKKIGYKKVKFCPDLAFGLPLSFGEVGGLKKYDLAVSFREDDFIGSDGVFNKEKLNTWLNNNSNLKICFVVQVQRDLNLQTNFRESGFFKEVPDLVVFNGDDKSEMDIIDVYQNSRCVLSNRLHVLIYSMMCGAIPFAIVKKDNIKVKGVFEKSKLSDYVFDYDNLPDFDSVPHDVQIRNIVDSERRVIESVFLEIFK